MTDITHLRALLDATPGKWILRVIRVTGATEGDGLSYLVVDGPHVPCGEAGCTREHPRQIMWEPDRRGSGVGRRRPAVAPAARCSAVGRLLSLGPVRAAGEAVKKAKESDLDTSPVALTEDELESLRQTLYGRTCGVKSATTWDEKDENGELVNMTRIQPEAKKR